MGNRRYEAARIGDCLSRGKNALIWLVIAIVLSAGITADAAFGTGGELYPIVYGCIFFTALMSLSHLCYSGCKAITRIIAFIVAILLILCDIGIRKPQFHHDSIMLLCFLSVACAIVLFVMLVFGKGSSGRYWIPLSSGDIVDHEIVESYEKSRDRGVDSEGHILWPTRKFKKLSKRR